MSRLVIAFVLFCTVAGFADLAGWGHGYAKLVLVELLFLIGAYELTPRGWRIVRSAALWFSVTVAALAIAQTFWMPRPHGPFRSANILGDFAVLMLWIAVPRGTLRYLAVPANLASLVLSQSRGAILAAVAGALAYGIARFPRRVIAAAIVGVALALYWSLSRHGVEIEARLGIWRIALISGLHRPLFGWGEGGVLIGWNGLTGYYSVALEWFVNAGAVGLAAACWLYIEALIASRHRPAERALLVAFLVQGMFMYGSAATYLPLVATMAWLAATKSSPVAAAGTPLRQPVAAGPAA